MIVTADNHDLIINDEQLGMQPGAFTGQGGVKIRGLEMPGDKDIMPRRVALVKVGVEQYPDINTPQCRAVDQLPELVDLVL